MKSESGRVEGGGNAQCRARSVPSPLCQAKKYEEGGGGVQEVLSY